jgi:p-cumate 2,3-dioxygenase alpha subunit
MYGQAAKDEITAIRARLVERYGEERAARLAGTGRHLITYPNFLINDAFGITMRVFTPLAPDLTEATQWAIVPREESGPRLERLLNDVQLSTGQGGFVNPDDAEAVESCQAGFAATEMDWSDISRGMHREPRNRDEIQMRAFWRQWHAQIQGLDKATSWDDRVRPSGSRSQPAVTSSEH